MFEQLKLSLRHSREVLISDISPPVGFSQRSSHCSCDWFWLPENPPMSLLTFSLTPPPTRSWQIFKIPQDTQRNHCGRLPKPILLYTHITLSYSSEPGFCLMITDGSQWYNRPDHIKFLKCLSAVRKMSMTRPSGPVQQADLGNSVARILPSVQILTNSNAAVLGRQ